MADNKWWEILRPIDELEPNIRRVRVVDYLLYLDNLTSYIVTAPNKFIVISLSSSSLDGLIECINRGDPFDMATLEIDNQNSFIDYQRKFKLNSEALKSFASQINEVSDKCKDYVVIIVQYEDGAEFMFRGIEIGDIDQSKNKYQRFLMKIGIHPEMIQILTNGNFDKKAIVEATPIRYCCHLCRKTQAKKKCPNCWCCYYCSEECQRNDWKKHKDWCLTYRALVCMNHLKV